MISFDEVKQIAMDSVDNSKDINDLLERIAQRIWMKGYSDGNIVQREQEKEIETLKQKMLVRFMPVRCKECRYSGLPYYDTLKCSKDGKAHYENWFCADGERKPTQTNAHK